MYLYDPHERPIDLCRQFATIVVGAVLPDSVMGSVNSISRRYRVSNSSRTFTRTIAHACASLLLLTAASVAAQSQSATVSSYHDPAELMRKAVQNEIKASSDDSAHFLFRGIKTTPQGSTTRLYVETKEATAGLVIAYNGKSLTPEQRQAEEARVER